MRARLLEGSQSPEAGSLGVLAAWDRMVIMESPNTPHEGRAVRDLAAEEGHEPFDVLLDIVIADGLRTGFQPRFPAEPDDSWKLRADVWRDPYTVVGGSDAGAHLDMMCGATYSTFLVGECVRDKGLLTMEEAVHQLAEVPARLYGADRPGPHRGRLRRRPRGVRRRPRRRRASCARATTSRAGRRASTPTPPVSSTWS